MYIQKKKNAFYLRRSEWDSEKQQTRSISTYLGSDKNSAIEKLKESVQEYDFLTLESKLLKLATATENRLTEILKPGAENERELVQKLAKLLTDSEIETLSTMTGR